MYADFQGCGSAEAAYPCRSRWKQGPGPLLWPAPPIKIVHHPIGRIFATKEGMTLYIYSKDGGHNSVCLEECLELWTPLYAKEGDQGMGLFSVFSRQDGAWQWTYKTRPLYTWQGDRKPGDIRGHGHKGRFHIAQP